MSSKKSVSILKDGPIKVSGFSGIEFAKEKIPTQDESYLCRCGESQNAPFCDGSHGKVGFSGDNQRDKTYETRNWQGATIETHFDANLCMHARYCKPLGELRDRELNGDKSAALDIAKIVTECPSGALTYKMKAGSQPIQFDDTYEIKIEAGGEVRILCEAEFDGVDLLPNQPKNRITLCRCGQSKNKPLCDASHAAKKGFK